MPSLNQSKDDLHHANFQQAGRVAQRLVEEDHVQPRLVGGVGSRGGAIPRTAQSLITAVDHGAVPRRLRTHQNLEEIRALRNLVVHLRPVVFCADFPLPGENDAGRLVRRKEKQMLQPPLEQIAPRATREEKVQVTAVGMTLTIGVVRQRDNLFPFRQSCVRRLQRRASEAQHGVRCRDVLACAQDLWNAKFQMVEVNV